MDANAIWPPNLSQVVPDAAISLVVGALLAFAIDRIQKRAADRAAAAEARRGWNRLQPRLRRFFSRPILYGQLESGWDDVGLSEVLSDEPIRDWSEMLASAPLEQLVRIDNNIGRWYTLRDHLRGHTARAVLDTVPTPPPAAFQVGAQSTEVEGALRSHLSGLPIEDQLSVTQYTSGLALQKATDWVGRAMQHPEIARAAVQFSQAQEQLKVDHDALRLHFARQDGIEA